MFSFRGIEDLIRRGKYGAVFNAHFEDQFQTLIKSYIRYKMYKLCFFSIMLFIKCYFHKLSQNYKSHEKQFQKYK
jgi:hypothetical protein